MKKLIVLGMSLMLGGGLMAQTTASHTMEAELQSTLGISMLTDLVSQSAVTNPFIFNTETEYANGIEQLAGATFGVTASVNWQVSFKSTSANFSNAGATATMPLNILQLKESVGGSYAGLTGANQVLTTGTPLLDILGLTSPIIVDYKMSPGTSYSPDIYTANVTYTIAAQ